MSDANEFNQILEDWNRLPQDQAMHVILPCNGSRAWAIGMVNARSFDTPAACFAASDKVWAGLRPGEQQEGFDSHPRLGEAHAKSASARSLAWSAGEQAQLAGETDTGSRLAAANRAYEAKFGRTFILCATGKNAHDVLAAIEARMGNTPEQEWSEAAEQQRKITQLRLRKWLGVS